MHKALLFNAKTHNMKKTFTLYLFFFTCAIQLFSQNECYINGAYVKVQTTAFIHVQGNFHLDNEGIYNGQLDNDGMVELRGNFIVDNPNVEQTGATGSSTGLVRFKNYGYTTETSHQNTSQRIEAIGTDVIGDRAFYDVEIENDNRTTAASTNDNYVDIKGGNVEIKNTLVFVNDSRIITDLATTGSDGDGSAYSYELYVSNTATNAITFNGAYSLNVTDYRTQAGRPTRYVEGKLAREVTGTDSYYFPVGLQPSIIGSDGMQAFNIDITSATKQKITSYVNGIDVTPLTNRNNYSDVGKDPGPAVDPFSNCIGGPDGIQDYMNLNQDQTHEWKINNLGTAFNYAIEIYPSNGLNLTAPNGMQAAAYTCGANSFVIRFLAKDGLLYDRATGALLPIGPAPLPWSNYGFPNGYSYPPPASELIGNKINNLASLSLSTFRIHSAANSATILPITLVSINAYPVNNQYIQVAWATLSELNNDYFEVQRSTNATDWETLGIVNGHGTTNEKNNYTYNDFNAQSGIIYYYRLRQVDFDRKFHFTVICSAKLEAVGNVLSISEFTPNPAVGTSTVQITSSSNKKLNYLFYDYLGQLMEQGSIDVEANTKQSLVFDKLNRLAASTYFLSITDGENTFYRKLIKEK